MPDIIIYEIGNALRYEVEFSVRDINKSLVELYELDLDIVAPLPDLLKITTQIAHSYKITFYDASYISLAQTLQSPFVTADEKLHLLLP